MNKEEAFKLWKIFYQNDEEALDYANHLMRKRDYGSISSMYGWTFDDKIKNLENPNLEEKRKNLLPCAIITAKKRDGKKEFTIDKKRYKLIENRRENDYVIYDITNPKKTFCVDPHYVRMEEQTKEKENKEKKVLDINGEKIQAHQEPNGDLIFKTNNRKQLFVTLQSLAIYERKYKGTSYKNDAKIQFEKELAAFFGIEEGSIISTYNNNAEKLLMLREVIKKDTSKYEYKKDTDSLYCFDVEQKFKNEFIQAKKMTKEERYYIIVRFTNKVGKIELKFSNQFNKSEEYYKKGKIFQNNNPQIQYQPQKIENKKDFVKVKPIQDVTQEDISREEIKRELEKQQNKRKDIKEIIKVTPRNTPSPIRNDIKEIIRIKPVAPTPVKENKGEEKEISPSTNIIEKEVKKVPLIKVYPEEKEEKEIEKPKNPFDTLIFNKKYLLDMEQEKERSKKEKEKLDKEREKARIEREKLEKLLNEKIIQLEKEKEERRKSEQEKEIERFKVLVKEKEEKERILKLEEEARQLKEEKKKLEQEKFEKEEQLKLIEENRKKQIEQEKIEREKEDKERKKELLKEEQRLKEEAEKIKKEKEEIDEKKHQLEEEANKIEEEKNKIKEDQFKFDESEEPILKDHELFIDDEEEEELSEEEKEDLYVNSQSEEDEEEKEEEHTFELDLDDESETIDLKHLFTDDENLEEEQTSQEEQEEIEEKQQEIVPIEVPIEEKKETYIPPKEKIVSYNFTKESDEIYEEPVIEETISLMDIKEVSVEDVSDFDYKEKKKILAKQFFRKVFGENAQTVKDFANRLIRISDYGNSESEYGWDIILLDENNDVTKDNIVIANLITLSEFNKEEPFISNGHTFYVNKDENKYLIESDDILTNPFSFYEVKRLANLNYAKSQKILYIYVKCISTDGLELKENNFRMFVDIVQRSIPKVVLSSFVGLEVGEDYVFIKFNSEKEESYEEIYQYSVLLNSYRRELKKEKIINAIIVVNGLNVPFANINYSCNELSKNDKQLNIVLKTLNKKNVDLTIKRAIHFGPQVLPQITDHLGLETIDRNTLKQSRINPEAEANQEFFECNYIYEINEE